MQLNKSEKCNSANELWWPPTLDSQAFHSLKGQRTAPSLLNSYSAGNTASKSRSNPHLQVFVPSSFSPYLCTVLRRRKTKRARNIFKNTNNRLLARASKCTWSWMQTYFAISKLNICLIVVNSDLSWRETFKALITHVFVQKRTKENQAGA